MSDILKNKDNASLSKAGGVVSRETILNAIDPPLVIVILLVCLYWRVISFAYTNYDDQNWIYANPMILRGISLESVRWTVTGIVNSTWCPLTNLSFLIESQIFGVHAAISHLINLSLHVANTLLLFRFIGVFLRVKWSSTLVTVLFAVHPVNVETVAWVSDRKGLLSATFLLLMLSEYLAYAKAQSPKRYWLLVLLYGLSLAAKPTVITVPAVLVLLDIWPLNRFGSSPRNAKRLLVEKIPFAAMACADAVCVYIAERDSLGIAHYPRRVNIQTALIGSARYIANFIYPTDLNVCYLHPKSWPSDVVVLAVTLLSIVWLLSLLMWRQDRSFVVCLSLFFISIAPVLELIPAGHSYMGDRFAYVPYIWLFIIVARFLPRGLMSSKTSLAVRSTIVIFVMGLIAMTSHQLGTWNNSVTLFNRAVSVDPENFIAQGALASAYSSNSNFTSAIAHITQAITQAPDNPYIVMTAAQIFEAAGYVTEAEFYYRRTCNIARCPPHMINYALFLTRHPTVRKPQIAFELARDAYIAAPSASTLDLFAVTLAECGQFDKAIQAETRVFATRNSSLYQQHLKRFRNNQTAAVE